MNVYKIKYWSDCAIGYIPADTYFWFYIDADELPTEEGLIEEGIEDGYRNFKPIFQKSTKIYNLQTNLIGQTLIDTINTFKYFNNKQITFPNGDIFDMHNVKTEIEHPFDTSLAIAKITFDIDETIVVNGGCC